MYLARRTSQLRLGSECLTRRPTSLRKECGYHGRSAALLGHWKQLRQTSGRCFSSSNRSTSEPSSPAAAAARIAAPPVQPLSPPSPSSPSATARLPEAAHRRKLGPCCAQWLRRDPTWRRHVYQCLELPFLEDGGHSSSSSTAAAAAATADGHSTSRTSKITNSHKLLLGETSTNFYQDSIPSFVVELKRQEQSSSTVQGLNNTLAGKFKEALNELVSLGLHEPRLLQKYNETLKWRRWRRELLTDVQQRREQVSYLENTRQRVEREILELQERLASMGVGLSSSSTLPDENTTQTAATANSNGRGEGLLDRALQTVQSVFLGENHTSREQDSSSSTNRQISDKQNILDLPTRSAPLQSAATQRDNTRDEIRHLQQKLENRRAMLQRHQVTLEAVEKKLNQLLDQVHQSPAPLSEPEMEAIDQAMTRVRPVVCEAFAQHVGARHARLLEQFQRLDRTTDLTKPHTWFPRARLERRTIIFHGGPTNSGKTYAALQRLKEAKRGAYWGPLRLLAAEIYEQLTIQGVYCNLYTGQERREIAFATHSSSTVEMASLTVDYDVVVLDEIQMLADSDRGFAWTRALLGCRCREIHVCGGLEAVPVVERLVRACGDDFELRTYERFAELRVADRSLSTKPNQLGTYGKPNRIQPGDCVVAFSRDDLFAIQREIESKTPHKCSIIYGSLPPATRSAQARRFNDPNSGYDVLVASDAIGMGLNLNIKRIIFNSVYKNDSSGIVQLNHSAIKQIAGRAGRRNSPYPMGEVTTRDPRDLPYLRECMGTDIVPISKAGLLPTASHIEVFSNALEEYGLGYGSKNLHKALLQFNDLANVQSDYFVCRQGPMVDIAKELADLDLSIADKYLFCLCPVQAKNGRSMQVMTQFARKIAAGEVAGLGRQLIPRKPESLDDLTNLCHLFNSLELFLWLQNKFPPANVMEQHTAMSRRDACVELIGKGLARSKNLKISHCYISRDKSLRLKINNENRPVDSDKDFVMRLSETDEDANDYYKRNDDDEVWDERRLRRWV